MEKLGFVIAVPETILLCCCVIVVIVAILLYKIYKLASSLKELQNKLDTIGDKLTKLEIDSIKKE